MTDSSKFNSLRRGFTLIELLVVLAVIAILMGIGVYTFGDIGDYRKLDSEARALSQEILVTRTLADTRNRMTQWQLVWYEDPNRPGELEYLSRVRVREDDGSEVRWRDAHAPRRIDSAVKFVHEAQYSTMLAENLGGDAVSIRAENPETIEFYDRGRTFGPGQSLTLAGAIAIRFAPNGQTNLSQNQKYFLTLYLDQDFAFDPESSQFLTLSVNPATGDTRVYER